MHPVYSQNDKLDVNINAAFNSKNILGFQNNLRFPNKSNIIYNLKYKNENFTSQLALNFNKYDELSFDDSFINYKKGITNFNVGKINRVWSFSEKTSLILSSNSRPIEALSVKVENKFKVNWLPSTAKWSMEAINATTNKSHNGKDSFLFGARVVISPSDRLNFELIQTSQYGGNNSKINASTINAVLFGNSNEGQNATINKMAGFGFSYSIPASESSYLIYGQIIGEDEAGNLPSCLSSMAGIQLSAPKLSFPTTLSIEFVDTRVKVSTHGNCGPNTMYNNGNYNYINYDTVLGAPIDTEGTSLELFGQSKLSNNLSMNYSASLITVNDKNFSGHRLSSKRSSGRMTSLGIKWGKNKFNINGTVSYQNFNLDKSDITKGAIFSVFSEVSF